MEYKVEHKKWDRRFLFSIPSMTRKHCFESSNDYHLKKKKKKIPSKEKKTMSTLHICPLP